MTIMIDDEIEAAAGSLDALEAELAERRQSAAAARAALAALAAREPQERVGWQGEHLAAWAKEREAAQRQASKAADGLVDLERRIAEATVWLAQLEGRRLARWDDPIAEARARLASIPTAIAGATAEARTLEERLRQLDVADAVGDAIPEGEPGTTSAKLETVRATIADLEREADRLQLRVATLAERRQAAVVELVNAERHRIAERWAALAAGALTAATSLRTIAPELDALEDEYRAAGARHGLPPGFATVDDPLFDPDGLERAMAALRG